MTSHIFQCFESMQTRSLGYDFLENKGGQNEFKTSVFYCSWDKELECLSESRHETIILTGGRGAGKSIAMRAAASKINEGSSNELAIYLDCNQIKAEFDSLVENLLKTRLKKDEIKKSEYKLIGQLACMIAVASFFDALTKAESRQFQASERLAKMVGSNFFSRLLYNARKREQYSKEPMHENGNVSEWLEDLILLLFDVVQIPIKKILSICKKTPSVILPN
ncbi:MAG: hypothetical protein AAFR90_14840 [Pseudomonadota bacterium]